MFAWCEEILKEKRSLFCHTSVIDFLKSSSGIPLSPPVMLGTKDDPDDRPTVEEHVPPA